MSSLVPRGLATLLLAGAALVAAACDAPPVVAPDPVAPDTAATLPPLPTVPPGVAVRAITVTPAALALHPAWTDSLATVVVDSTGQPLSGRDVTYASDDTTIVRVRPGGVVTGAGEGRTTVRVTSGGVTVRVPVVVTTAPTASIAIVPGDTTITEGQQRLLTAVLRDARGNALGGRALQWTTTRAAVAAVSSIGTYSHAAAVAAVGPGEATIAATNGGVTASITIRVRPRVASVVATPDTMTLHIGGTGQVTATLRDAAGNVLTDRPVTYMAMGGIAVASPTGVVRALLDGVVHVVVRAEGVADTVRVTVLRPVYFVDVTPRIIAMSVGTTLPLTVTLRDNSGRVVTGRELLFSSSNPGVATVSGTGVVTAVGRGVAMISVTSEGVTQRAQVTVP